MVTDAMVYDLWIIGLDEGNRELVRDVQLTLGFWKEISASEVSLEERQAARERLTAFVAHRRDLAITFAEQTLRNIDDRIAELKSQHEGLEQQLSHLRGGGAL